MTARRLRDIACGGIVVAMIGCGLPPASTDAAPSADLAASADSAGSAVPAASAAPAPAPAASAAPAPAPVASGPPSSAGALAVDAGPEAGGAETAGASAAPPPFAADNDILPPLSSDELTERARGLFEAIVRDEPSLGDPFWFPREPFIPLKDVKGPERYWETLHSTYRLDIHALHRKRKSWDGTEFAGFVTGSTPKWVKPGDEANKIGYFRSFRGKLRYRFEGKLYSIEVHTIISWQGKWYITHLRKFRK